MTFDSHTEVKKRPVAVITGASRGIGRAIALKFAKEGYLLVLNARNEAALRALPLFAADVAFVPGDIAVPETSKRLAEAAASLSWAHGQTASVDVLVNNAGISDIGLVQDMSSEAWMRLIGTNLSGAFYASQAMLPYMIQQKSGRILNISSVWGVCGASCEAAYSASKGGMNALTEAMAKELAPSGIAVNAIACGAIDTEMNAQLSDEERHSLLEEIPAGRMGTPEEVAEVCFALAGMTPYLTGQIIRLDGGWI